MMVAANSMPRLPSFPKTQIDERDVAGQPNVADILSVLVDVASQLTDLNLLRMKWPNTIQWFGLTVFGDGEIVAGQ